MLKATLKSLEEKYISFGAKTALSMNELAVRAFQGVQRFASSPEVNAIAATMIDPEVKNSLTMRDSRFRTVITLPFVTKEEWQGHVDATNKLSGLIQEKYFNYYQEISRGLNGVK